MKRPKDGIRLMLKLSAAQMTADKKSKIYTLYLTNLFAEIFQNRVGDFQVSLSAAQLNLRLVGPVEVRSPGDFQAVILGQLPGEALLLPAVGGVENLHRVQARVPQAREEQPQLLKAQLVEHGVGQDGNTAVLLDQADGLVGGHLLPGNKTGRPVSDIAGKGLLDGGYVPLLQKITGKVGPGPDTVREGFRHGLPGDGDPMLPEAADDGQVPPIPGILEFLQGFPEMGVLGI